jgi:signal transduction histidine kinase
VVSVICSSVLITAGTLVLFGWQFRIPVLKGQFHETFITPVTALHFILLAMALLVLHRPERFGLPLQWTARLLAFFVSVWALAVCFEFASGRSLGIDAIFFSHRLNDWTLLQSPRGRYVWPTAVAFASAGLSITVLNWPRRKARASELLGAPLALVILMALIGQLFGINQLYGRWMAIPTSILFLLLAIDLFISQRAPSIAAKVLGETAGGIVARRLLVVIFLFLPLISWLKIVTQKAGIDPNLAAAIRVIIEMLFFSILIWRTTIILDRLDQYRKSSERVLQQQEKLATLGRYAATIAHEINNPLAAATNLVYLASLSKTTPENRKEYLQSCQSELSRIAHVVRHTLGFYRENASLATINLAELFRDLVFSFRQKLGAKRIDVAVSSPEGAQLTAVRGELIQILSNLLSNAIDAAPDTAGQVRLSATIQGADAIISVEDNGPGIPPEAAERIFEPFFSTKKEFGTGIGLWLSLELAKKNKATIRVESRPGKTCLSLLLRAAVSQSDDQRVAALHGSPTT